MISIDVLAAAQSLIQQDDGIKLIKCNGRVLDRLGKWVVDYADPVELAGNAQPLNKSQYKECGLDLSKSYIQVWAHDSVREFARDTTADRVVYQGGLYELVSSWDWHSSATWGTVIAVRIGNAE